MRTSWLLCAGAVSLAGALLVGCLGRESSQTASMHDNGWKIGRTASWAGVQWVGNESVEFVPRRGVGGASLLFSAGAGGKVQSRPSPFGWSREVEVTLALENASYANPVAVQFDCFDGDGNNHWSKTVTFRDEGWRAVTLGVPDLRFTRSIVSRSRAVFRWEMTFSRAAEVRVQRGEGAPEGGLQMLGMAAGVPASVRAGALLRRWWDRGRPLPVRAMLGEVTAVHGEVWRLAQVGALEQADVSRLLRAVAPRAF